MSILPRCDRKLLNTIAELRREAAFAIDYSHRHALHADKAEKAQDHLNDARWYARTDRCDIARRFARQAAHKLRAFRQMVAREREHGREWDR